LAYSGVALNEGITPADWDEVAVRSQLARIFKSSDFETTERGRKFLAYVVEETLGRRADRIKAYSIATEVFGRDASFDAHSDPIVRIEAGHLRRALDRYYLTDGKADPIVITIPKGHYVPVFSERPQDAVAAPPIVAAKSSLGWPSFVVLAVVVVFVSIGAWRLTHLPGGLAASTPGMPRLLVQPFEDLSRTGNSAAITKGLTEEVIAQIAKFRDIVVVEVEREGEGQFASDESAQAMRYALTGSVLVSDETVRLQARVVNQRDGSVVWANSYEGDLKVSELLRVEAEIAQKVATTLAQPYGVVFRADASQSIDNPPENWAAYACTLSYYAYRAGLDAKTHPEIRDCLEDAVQQFPSYATAWALLSQTYVDEIRFHYPIEPASTPASIERALEAAQKAVELDPENVRGLQALMFAHYFNHDIQLALEVGERAMALNPNDTELMGEFGFRLALSGDWGRGCPLVEEARSRNPGPLAYYEAALSLCAYFLGNYEEAAQWIKKTGAPGNPNYHVIAAAVFAEGGYTADAERERAWLMAYEPELVKNIRKVLALSTVREEDRNRLVASLKKAGLPITD
jgi:TolB-like protein